VIATPVVKHGKPATKLRMRRAPTGGDCFSHAAHAQYR
jgi:hypothetical protein